MENIINICSKGLLEYSFECINFFNSFPEEKLTLKAIGSANIANAIEIAHLLTIYKDILKINIENTSMGHPPTGIKMPTLKILLSSQLSIKKVDPQKISVDRHDFVDYAIYNLLLNWKLHKEGKITIQVFNYGNYKDIVELKSVDKNIECTIVPERADVPKSDKELVGEIKSALGRAGYLLPENLKEISQTLSMYDDVLLGVDTNILYNCTVSEHLIPLMSLINPKEFVHTPNWILLVITSAVMHELEESSNIKEDGYLLKPGRMGYRALQEIMELNQNKGIAGLSTVIVGQFDPVLDTRVELQGLRKDLEGSRLREINDKYEKKLASSDTVVLDAKTTTGIKNAKDKERKSAFTRKSSSGDMIIRDQFKGFLKQIDFHKGIYFLTADKTNAALARAEGLHSIYFKPVIDPKAIFDSLQQDIHIHVSIGKIFYELAVEFGQIFINHNGVKIKISCDRKGESLEIWLERKLRIKHETRTDNESRLDINALFKDYQGYYDFNQLLTIWDELITKFQGLES